MLKQFTFAIFNGLAAPAIAGSPLYSPEELSEYRATIDPILRDNFYRLVIGSMPLPDRLSAGQIRIDTISADSGTSPLEFSANSELRIIRVPMATFRFLDDLFTLEAWFARHGCPQEAIQSYLSTALKTATPSQPPLEAFGISREEALADTEVRDFSNELLKINTLFLLAHETGHIVLGHGAGVAAPQSQAEELAADAFALDRFAALGVPPNALAYYFSAAAWLDTDPSASIRATHPLSGARLDAIADRFASCPECFTASASDPEAAVTALADLPRVMRELGALIQSDRYLQNALALRANFTAATFATLCRPEPF
jgi:hypothetical protein